MLEINNTIIKQKDIDFNSEHVSNIEEAIAIAILKENNIHGNYISDDLIFQLTKGDIELSDNTCIDIKSCYTYKDNNSLAIDVLYYKCDNLGNAIRDEKGNYTPHKQGVAESHLGWLYQLKDCDMLFLVNRKEHIFFIVEDFQAMRKKLLDTFENNKILFCIKDFVSKDTNGYGYVTKLTYTYYLNLDSIYINQLNTSIHKYEYFIEDNKE